MKKILIAIALFQSVACSWPHKTQALELKLNKRLFQDFESRTLFDCHIISEEKFNECFNFALFGDSTSVYINGCHYVVTNEEENFLKSNFGKSFLCSVSESCTVGDSDLVEIIDIGYKFPVELFCKFITLNPPSVSANRVCGFIGFENKKL